MTHTNNAIKKEHLAGDTKCSKKGVKRKIIKPKYRQQ